MENLINFFCLFFNSLSLYRKSECDDLFNLIERILCGHSCYYFPAKCFLSRRSNLKNLLLKSLHEKLNPHFNKIFENCETKKATLELTPYGAPRLDKLAEDIGFNTKLEYEGDHMKIDLSILTEDLWM